MSNFIVFHFIVHRHCKMLFGKKKTKRERRHQFVLIIQRADVPLVKFLKIIVKTWKKTTTFG